MQHRWLRRGSAVVAALALGACNGGGAASSGHGAGDAAVPPGDALAFTDRGSTSLQDAGRDASAMVDAGDAAVDTPPPQPPATPVALRYLAMNVGNVTPGACWEYKLCQAQVVGRLRDYIAAWQPDVVLLSEVARAEQLAGVTFGGPLLPAGYAGLCGESRDRPSDAPASWDAPGASHEHECVAYKLSRLAPLPGSARSVYGRNDAVGQASCGYDFTSFGVRLLLDGLHEIDAVAVHPDASQDACRIDEIQRSWSELAAGPRVVIGGDWNTDDAQQLQRPATFQVNYSAGWHWDLVQHPGEHSAWYGFGLLARDFDHTFSNFGRPCSNCGARYGTDDLPYGSALGGYDGHPRADGGSGCDHRQILVDLLFDPS